MTLTLQQMFDTVLTNLTTQGVASTGRTNPECDISCQYRGTEGRKCAAGWLIADEHYTRELEGKIAVRGAPFEALVKSGVPDTAQASNLVDQMQQTHDNHMPDSKYGEHTIGDFHEQMKAVARQLGLTFTLPTA
jgi:hypothetical protein